MKYVDSIEFKGINKKLPEWNVNEKKLNRSFTFVNFRQAMAFMVQLSYEAEQMQHHPEWKNVYNTVTVDLTTHDAENTVTEKDVNLALKMDEIYNQYSK